LPKQRRAEPQQGDRKAHSRTLCPRRIATGQNPVPPPPTQLGKGASASCWAARRPRGPPLRTSHRCTARGVPANSRVGVGDDEPARWGATAAQQHAPSPPSCPWFDACRQGAELSCGLPCRRLDLRTFRLERSKIICEQPRSSSSRCELFSIRRLALALF